MEVKVPCGNGALSVLFHKHIVLDGGVFGPNVESANRRSSSREVKTE